MTAVQATRTSAANGQRGGSARPVTARPVPVRRRRRPALTALGVALVALGALSALWLSSRSSEQVPVLAVARHVSVGDAITNADLRVAMVSPDAAIMPVAQQDKDLVVGHRAATELVPGTLLVVEQVRDQELLESGETLVGLSVNPGQMPDRGLAAGDDVLVVTTPPVDGDVGDVSPSTQQATVVHVGARDDTGVRVVDVTVQQEDAARLAAQAATGRIALVLQSPGQ